MLTVSCIGQCVDELGYVWCDDVVLGVHEYGYTFLDLLISYLFTKAA